MLAFAGLVLWIAGGVYFLLRWGVFTPQGFDKSPTRQSDLSLPVVGGVLLVYILAQFLVLGVALATGVVSMTDLEAEGAPPVVAPTTQVAVPDTRTSPASQASAPSQPTAEPAETQAVETGPPTEPAPREGKPQRNRAVMETLLGACVYALTIIPVLLIVPRMFPNGMRGLGMHWTQLSGAWKGAVAFAVYYPIWLLAAEAIYRIYVKFHFHMEEHPTIEALTEHPSMWSKVVLVLGAVVMAPIAEELGFRGILQTTLLQRGFGFLMPQLMRIKGPAGGLAAPALPYVPAAWHRWLAIVLAGAAFACVHQWSQAPMIFVLALGLGYAYERTGKLWVSITFHFLFNLVNIGTLLTS